MKYVPGLMVGQLSGKAGSTVASRNKGGSYFRTRVIPKLVQNALTAAVRANFGDSAQAYRGITESGRLAWTALGAQMLRKTSLGETIHLTGQQAMVALNRNRFSINQDPNYVAPPFTSPPPFQQEGFFATAGAQTTTTIVAGANSATQNVTSSVGMVPGTNLTFPATGDVREVISVTDATHVVLNLPVLTVTADTVDFRAVPDISLDWTPDPLPADIFGIIECTAPLSAGVSRPSRGQFRTITYLPHTATSGAALGFDYMAVFGQPLPGQKIFLRARLITRSGFAGPVAAAEVIVT